MLKKNRLAGLPASLLRDRAGTAAVEMGLLAPVFAAMIIPVVDLGMGFYTQMRVQEAAAAGAEYALLNASAFNQANTQTAAQNATTLSVTANAAQEFACASGTTLTVEGSQVTCPDGTTAGTYVTVSTSANYTMLLNYPGLSNPLTLTGSSTVRIQ